MLDVEGLKSRCQDVDERVLRRHVERLPEDYRDKIGPDEAAEHFAALRRLSDESPARVLVEALSDDRVGCTVVAFDHPFEFSLITGTLAGLGFEVLRGDVYTLPAVRGDEAPRPRHPNAPPGSHRRHQVRLGGAKRDPMRAAVLIDRFVGRREAHTGSDDFDAWTQRVAEEITHVLRLVDQRDDKAAQRAKGRVNELVTRRLEQMPTPPEPRLFPVELSVEPVDRQRVRLTIAAQDTPAFLYSLSTALSLQGLNIDRVRITTDVDTGVITDQIDLVRPRADRPLDARVIERAKLVALLTKQFTYHLERAPDPFTALTRFERLTQDVLSEHVDDDTGGEGDRWVNLLADPAAMGDLAKLLGTSDFLWEDFIRGQYESLMPMLAEHGEGQRYAEPPETLPYRLQQALEGAVGLAQIRDRLNKFKDRETFLIDLDHILNREVSFRGFSEHLTALAEVLVAASTRLVHDDLAASCGRPARRHASGGKRRRDAGASGLAYAVFGLGKLGGVALGYASDIELLYVHDADPAAMTPGGKRKPISNAEFFQQMTEEASRFIHAKREGIFEVDLRLRPYGKEGPLATTVDLFTEYYGPDGPSHPFERLALVRLRWIAGNPELGFRVEELRNQFVYDRPWNDEELGALWSLWEKAKKEKLAGQRTPNAKYSPGALVDLEGTIQLMQVLHARHAPQLRVPRLSQAMEALQRGGFLSPKEYAELRGAYDFLRQLINGLRMLRGSAQDLFLPEADDPEMVHLARRMGYAPNGRGSVDAQLSADLERHVTAVRRFVREHFGRNCPGEGG